MIPAKRKFENPFEHYLRIVMKRKWTLTFAFTVCVVLAFVHYASQPPMYSSTAKILISLRLPQLASDQSYFSNYSTDYYLTQFEILKSRPILSKVIERLNLVETYRPSQSPKERLLEKLHIASKTRTATYTAESLYPIVRGMIGISSITKAGLVSISVYGSHPRQVKEIANTVVEVFIEETMESSVRSAFQASEYLKSQLSKLNNNIQEAEQKLEAFEKREGLTGIIGRHQDLDTQEFDQFLKKYTSIRQQRWELEARVQALNQLIRQGNFVGLTIPTFQNETLSKLSGELIDSEEQLARYQMQDLKEKHPSIVKTKENIRFIKERIVHEARKWNTALDTEIAMLRSQEANFEKLIHANQDSVAGSLKRGAEYNFLVREAAIHKSLYETYDTQLKKIQLLQDVTMDNVRVIEPAEQPRRPYAPDRRMNLLLGVLVGLTLGFFLVFLREYLDNTIKSSDDVESFLSLPLLGTVPRMGDRLRSSQLIHSYSGDNNDVLTDAYRTLRTNLQFFQDESPLKTILVTSAVPSEGKSTTVANLALTLVQMGKKVLLVDADLRKPVLHKTFKLNDGYGITSLFAGIKERQKLIKPTRTDRLMVFQSGPIPPNPTELLASSTFRQVIENLKPGFDFVLFDSPPILAVADASILASMTDGVILVINAGQTSIKSCQIAMEQLAPTKCNLIGCVLNRFDYKEAGYYGYYGSYYRYGYGSNSGSRTSRNGKKEQPSDEKGREEPASSGLGRA